MDSLRAQICPTVTAVSKDEYSRQLKKLIKIAPRIHFDVSDGSLAPRELLPFGSMRWPKKIIADIHVMSMHPHAELAIAYALKPHLVILHAESHIDFSAAADALHRHHIKVGLALLPETKVSQFAELIREHIDHVLIFSGNLGYQGGSEADLSLLNKAKELKEIKNALEIGWDGGVNEKNIEQIVTAGVRVINVGSYIAHSHSSKAAYAKLKVKLKH